jgi:hypothetical protein
MSKKEGRFSRVWWPTIETVQDAEKAAKNGAWYALVVGVVTGGAATYSLATGNSLLGINAWGYIDASAFLLLSFFMFRLSRVAAVLALLLYAAERAVQAANGLAQSQAIVTVIFGLFFVNAVRGTFAYRRFLALGSVSETKTSAAPPN